MLKPNYSILLHKQARKGLEKLPLVRQEQVRDFVNNHLRVSPKQPIVGKTKLLSGSLKGIYQYDLSRGDRVWWRVDDEKMVVEIIYIGSHPKVTD